MLSAVLTAVLITKISSIDCLAMNIYHEARGEPKIGQIAVGHVTLNRLNSKKYPNSICKVVYQKKQFSWTYDRISNIPKDVKTYRKIRMLSRDILKGKYKDPTLGSLYYHAKRIRPKWSSKAKKIVIIGKHIFYKKL